MRVDRLKVSCIGLKKININYGSGKRLLLKGRNKMKRVIHFRSIRLRSNAGMDFPACYANAKMLDLDKSRLTATGAKELVTCKRCLRIIKVNPWR